MQSVSRALGEVLKITNKSAYDHRAERSGAAKIGNRAMN